MSAVFDAVLIVLIVVGPLVALAMAAEWLQRKYPE